MQIMDLEYNALKAYQRLHRFNASGAALNIALAAKNVPAALTQVFTKLYTLRNQIIHGGATYNSQINREQLKDVLFTKHANQPDYCTNDERTESALGGFCGVFLLHVTYY